MNQDDRIHNAVIFTADINKIEVYFDIPSGVIRKSDRKSKYCTDVFECLKDAIRFCKENGYSSKDISILWSNCSKKKAKKQKMEEFQKTTGILPSQFHDIRCLRDVACLIVNKIDILKKFGVFDYVPSDEIEFLDSKDDPLCRNRFETLASKLNEIIVKINVDSTDGK